MLVFYIEHLLKLNRTKWKQKHQQCILNPCTYQNTY